jgi:hypothetical protein
MFNNYIYYTKLHSINFVLNVFNNFSYSIDFVQNTEYINANDYSISENLNNFERKEIKFIKKEEFDELVLELQKLEYKTENNDNLPFSYSYKNNNNSIKINSGNNKHNNNNFEISDNNNNNNNKSASVYKKNFRRNNKNFYNKNNFYKNKNVRIVELDDNTNNNTINKDESNNNKDNAINNVEEQFMDILSENSI